MQLFLLPHFGLLWINYRKTCTTTNIPTSSIKTLKYAAIVVGWNKNLQMVEDTWIYKLSYNALLAQVWIFSLSTMLLCQWVSKETLPVVKQRLLSDQCYKHNQTLLGSWPEGATGGVGPIKFCHSLFFSFFYKILYSRTKKQWKSKTWQWKRCRDVKTRRRMVGGCKGDLGGSQARGHESCCLAHSHSINKAFHSRSVQV